MFETLIKELRNISMFDALLKGKFYSKCKSDIKLTMTRIEMIKKKRKAMEKYLRNDVSDLLKNGLDYNAYGRVAGLYVEQNMSSCYDIVEQLCMLISDHLPAMNKQMECPEECREAVPSLMFAAARLADLPELRELRSLFYERYGNSLEPFINNELVKKLKAGPPTKDMKLQLMKEIAHESGIEWDPKALEQKLYRPPQSAQDWFQNANEDENNQSQNTNIQEMENEHSNAFYTSSPSDTTTSRENSTSPEDSTSEDVFEGKKSRFRSVLQKKVPSIKEKTSDTSPNFGRGKKDQNSKSKTTKAPISVRSRPLKQPPGYNENKEDSKPKFANGEIHDHRDEESLCSTECVVTPMRNEHTRTNSYQPNSSLTSPSGHVHPKLPDYEDLVARLAALRAN